MGCIHPHSVKIICMLIHADILNEAQLLNNHVILYLAEDAAFSCSHGAIERKLPFCIFVTNRK